MMMKMMMKKKMKKKNKMMAVVMMMMMMMMITCGFALLYSVFSINETIILIVSLAFIFDHNLFFCQHIM